MAESATSLLAYDSSSSLLGPREERERANKDDKADEVDDFLIPLSAEDGV
jgi:hypothetical protein